MYRVLFYLILVGNIYACPLDFYFSRVYPKDYQAHYVTPKPQHNISVRDPNEPVFQIGRYFPIEDEESRTHSHYIPLEGEVCSQVEDQEEVFVEEEFDEDEGDEEGVNKGQFGRRISPDDSLDQFKKRPKDAGHWRGVDIGKELGN